MRFCGKRRQHPLLLSQNGVGNQDSFVGVRLQKERAHHLCCSQKTWSIGKVTAPSGSRSGRKTPNVGWHKHWNIHRIRSARSAGHFLHFKARKGIHWQYWHQRLSHWGDSLTAKEFLILSPAALSSEAAQFGRSQVMKRPKFKQFGANLGIAAPESKNSKVTAGAAFTSQHSQTLLLRDYLVCY